MSLRLTIGADLCAALGARQLTAPHFNSKYPNIPSKFPIFEHDECVVQDAADKWWAWKLLIDLPDFIDFVSL